MEKETVGIVTAVLRQWWLKINTKPVRMGAFDGALFPHVIKVKYTVSGKDYVRMKWLGAYERPPLQSSKVKVFYDENRPKKARIVL